MEVKFNRNPLSCMKPIVSQVHAQEQVQEVRLPDGYPDIGKILGCWGQVLMRGKEWRSTGMSTNGGVMAWVLYAPEDGTQPRVVDAWIPFQSRWEFPQAAENGVTIIKPMVTSLDGRSLSARKMMIRANVDTLAQAMESQKVEVAMPAETPEDVQLLKRSYPVEVPMEAGEKQVQIEEVLSLPNGNPPIYKMVSYTVDPTISEQKVLSNRLVFRGQAAVHIHYLTEEGSMQHWETEIPFSQYTELDRDYGTNAVAWVVPVLTAAELDTTEDGNLEMRAGIAAQYVIFDGIMLDLVEDAYSPVRDVKVISEELKLPVRLDSGEIELSPESPLPDDMDRILSMNAMPEQPSLRMGENGMEVSMEGQYQLLYQDSEGQLRGDNVRFRGNAPFPSAPENQVSLWLDDGTQPELLPGNTGMTIQNRYNLTSQVYAGQPISMVTGLELGEKKELSASRPSIILRRVDEGGLWNLAKESGSTVDAIQKANQLVGEPEQGRMLLIPVS